jgi:transcriptional regulator with AAA-type ATPase domain/transcriptional regulatory protein LevR
MNGKFKKIIGGENKKNPLTDQEIAEKMNLSREKITLLRKENNIPSSKERLKPLLKKEIKKILADNGNISIRQLTEKIKERGFEVSRYIVRQEYNKLSEEQSCRKNESEINSEADNYSFNSNFLTDSQDSFAEIIGAELSLKTQIQQAKAAVLYPPHGLHTLIIGESGVGKSFLAEQMYKFAERKNKIEADKFVVFNCADYAENPQLLYSHLFGHKKGSFTGAEKDKAGLIKKADNGILFLDEVHRLSSEGQEMLFNVIDNGFYRKLGETEKKEKINLMIIAATTEDIKSNLLATFRRRIPLIIDLPPLNKRTLEEKLKFIKQFIARESRQINQKIILEYEAARALISFEPENNIGQLESKIKEICARAYLNFISGKSKSVRITLDLLDLKIQRSFFEGSVKREDIKKLIKDDIVLSPEAEKISSKVDFKKTYKLDNDIYKYLEKKNKELYSLGFSKEEINKKLNQLLAEKVKSVFNKAEKSFFKNEEILKEIVSAEVLDMVNDVLVIVHRELPEFVLNQRLKYALAIHLDAVIERIKSGKIIKHPDLGGIKHLHQKLYDISKEIVEYLNQEYALQIPVDEIGYITMYLNSVLDSKDEKEKTSKPGVIVVSHGGVASEMLKVSNWLLGESNAVAVDMHLDQSPNQILENLLILAEEVDQGKGILLLVDMGSLKSFGDIITEKTGIKTKVISRVDTVMLMEAIRWSRIEDFSLEELYKRINKQKFEYTRDKREKIILIYCITGEGAAQRIADYIKHRVPSITDEFKLQTTGFYDKDLSEYISNLSTNKNIAAVVGNIETDLVDNFYSIEEIYSEKGFDQFIKSVGFSHQLKNESNLEYLFDKNLIYPNLKAESKDEILDFLAGELYKEGIVDSDYLQDVKNREKWGVTYVGNKIAIPHAESSKHVNYSQVALAVLDEEIEWSGYMAKLVCLFAYKNIDTDYFRKFYKKLENNFDSIIKENNLKSIKRRLINE